MKLRYTFSLMKILKFPCLISIMQDLKGFLRMHFIYAAYESGLLAALDTPRNRDGLIEEIGVIRTDLLDALLDMGIATGELSRRNGRYQIKGKRSRAILGDRGDALAATIQANVSYYSDAYRNAASRLKGGELGDDLDEIGDVVARFSKIAEPILRDFIKTIASNKKTLRILDVGCGSGVYLQSTYDANPDARGIGLEIDDAVVRQAEENLAAWGLTERFRILHGDIRHPPEAVTGSFNLITLYNMLYYFEDKERASLLENLRTMLSPKGVLAIVMNYRSHGKDLGAANLNMVNCSLKGLTRLPDLEEMTSMLRQCGYTRIEVHRFMPASTFLGIVAGA